MSDDFLIRDRPGAPIGQALKTPAERRQYTFDYSNWLDDGERVNEILAVVVPQQEEFVDNTPLSVDTIAVSGDGLAGSVFADFGSEGLQYAIRLVATTSIARIKEDGLLVSVTNDVDNNFGSSCGCSGSSLVTPITPIIITGPPSPISIYQEQLIVLGTNALGPLRYAPLDSTTSMQLIVNGRVFAACETPPPFFVTGVAVSWASTLFGIALGDTVIARYQFAATTIPPVPSPASSLSLYYIATAGQTVFSLSTPDRFGRFYSLQPLSTAQVSRNGARLMPNDAVSAGSYTMSGNVVTLDWPAGEGETVIIDILGLPELGDEWWLHLPTTLPPIAGTLWNNGGVICVS